MSTNEQLDSGGSGDTSSTSTSSDGTAEITVSNLAGSYTFEVALPGWLQALRPLVGLARHPVAWITAAIVGISVSEARFRIARGESPAELIVEDYLYRQLLLPAFAGVVNFGVSLLTEAVIILFGPDFAIGRPVGIVDSPFLLSGPIAGVFQGLALTIVGTIHELNLGIASGLEPLGLAAPAVATGLWVVQFAGLAWGLYVLASSVDVPVLNVGGFLKAVTLPLRNLLGVFR